MQSCVLRRLILSGGGGGVVSWGCAAAASLLVPSRHFSREISQPTHHSHPHLLAEGEILPGMHKSEFAARRTVLMAEIAGTHTGMTNPNHLVIIPGAPIKYMSADVPYRFHQHSDLLYLTGCQEPDVVLLLESIHGQPLPVHKSTLYVRPRDPFRELWDGPRMAPDGAVEFIGVDEAFSIDDLAEHLEKRYSTGGYTVWYYTEDMVHPAHHELIISSLTNSPQAKIKSVHSPSHSLHRMRLAKSLPEIALMRKSGEITTQAFRQVMKDTRPSMNESHLESIFEHSVKMQGAQWMSYPPVVAGGRRANCLHYITNNRTLNAGDLVLMDAGCEYYGYVSDVTRTWPVSGTFTPAQRDLYEAVLSVKQESIRACRPGVTLNYLHSAAVNMIASELKALGIISNRSSGTQLYELVNKLYPHHLGHYLGMDTHDTMVIDRNTPLAPGMVITIEPGIYIPHNYTGDSKMVKEVCGTGIRIEDDVLLTEDGAEILNKGCPETVEEITALIAS